MGLRCCDSLFHPKCMAVHECLVRAPEFDQASTGTTFSLDLDPAHQHCSRTGSSRIDVAVSSAEEPTEGDLALFNAMIQEMQTQRQITDHIMEILSPPLASGRLVAAIRRYLRRRDFLLDAVHRAIQILFWDDGAASAVCYCVFFVCCLQPALSIIYFHWLLLHTLFRSYQTKLDRERQGIAMEPPHRFGERPPLAPTAASVKHNLRNIQNYINALVSINDLLYSLRRTLDWTNQARTLLILQTILISLLFNLLLFLCFSFNYLVLLWGTVVLFAGNPLVRAMFFVFVPILRHKLGLMHHYLARPLV
ncbi:hypothetical protein HDU91_005608 [Kappamyces sp. JEL0680]|nr:hypothetical protein HDU91_005608 [Kappamyces sp. JEL0680]